MMVGHVECASEPDAGPSVTCVAIDSARRRALTGHADGSVSLWDIDAAESESAFMLHDDAVAAAVLTADGQLVISMDTRTVRVSELSGETSEVVASSPSRVMRFVALGAFEGRPVAVARSYDRSVLRVIDLDSGQLLVHVREAHPRIVTAVCLPDGNALGLTEAGDLEVWGAGGQGPRARIVSDLPSSSHISTSPKGEVVAAGKSDGHLIAWDLETHDRLFDVVAHAAAVRAIAFDESGNHVTSVADDGSLWLGSARSGERLAAWETSGPIGCCAATSRLAAVDVEAYRQHALTRAPVTIIVGTDAGAVHFINCAGLTPRLELGT